MPAQLFGVTMSTGLVRGATVSEGGELLEVTERPVSMDRALDNACDAALELAAAAGHDAPVMAIGGDPEDWVGRGGVRLIGECDAFLAAARVEGCVDDVRVVAVVDVGRVGTRIHVLDTLTGRLISSVGTDEFSGDALTMAVTSYLWSTYGAAERGGPAEMSSLAAASDRAVRLLGTERAVDLSGPFVTDPVRLRRTEFDAIAADCAVAVQPLIDDAVRLGAQVVLLVGGGAESTSVVDVVAHRTAAPVRVPRHPAAFSAMGAAHLSTVIPSARLFAAPRTVPAQRVPVVERTDPPVPATPAPMGAHAAAGRRRSPRVAAVAGTAALVAVATLGAAAGASERGPVDVRATDRVVATSGVSTPDATPAQTRPQGAAPAPTSADTPTTTTATTAPTLPLTDVAGTVTSPPPVTTSTDPRQPTATAPSSGSAANSPSTAGNTGPGRSSAANGGGGRDTPPTRDRDDDPTPHPPATTSVPSTPATTSAPPVTTTVPSTSSAPSTPRTTTSHR
ncbi:hypothetical protein [Rhodococcoides corynebacterioides]|uniref:hypothetical protein n=1 Tax=Rhodococcoides corynebacterioides TaxID=53972 RepID=UPI001C9B8D0F|nr:hypothetical protein [Rhodococcus corynebacterioides]MBY6361484.1 hypothetical protein [Rhodococcus corynebacterioides]